MNRRGKDKKIIVKFSGNTKYNPSLFASPSILGERWKKEDTTNKGKPKKRGRKSEKVVETRRWIKKRKEGKKKIVAWNAFK